MNASELAMDATCKSRVIDAACSGSLEDALVLAGWLAKDRVILGGDWFASLRKIEAMSKPQWRDRLIECMGGIEAWAKFGSKILHRAAQLHMTGDEAQNDVIQRSLASLRFGIECIALHDPVKALCKALAFRRDTKASGSFSSWDAQWNAVVEELMDDPDIVLADLGSIRPACIGKDVEWSLLEELVATTDHSFKLFRKARLCLDHLPEQERSHCIDRINRALILWLDHYPENAQWMENVIMLGNRAHLVEHQWLTPEVKSRLISHRITQQAMVPGDMENPPAVLSLPLLMIFGRASLNIFEHKPHWFKGMKLLLDSGMSARDVVDLGDAGQRAQQAFGGWTPLHWACHVRNKEFAATLIEYGADIHARNWSGKRPVDLLGEDDELRGLMDSIEAGQRLHAIIHARQPKQQFS